MKKIYYVKGKVFNEENTQKSLAFARHYAKENGIDFKDIYELSNETEVKYLEMLLSRKDVYEIKSHEKVALIGFFKNSNNDNYPATEFETSFTYKDKLTNKVHIIFVADSVYDLNKSFILAKSIYDFTRKDSGVYLETYYLQDNEWKEWKIGNIELSIQEKKERHKKYLAQKKVIRDRQKYDRLIRLRSNGTITENQSKELYRLEKVFGGKE